MTIHLHEFNMKTWIAERRASSRVTIFAGMASDTAPLDFRIIERSCGHTLKGTSRFYLPLSFTSNGKRFDSDRLKMVLL